MASTALLDAARDIAPLVREHAEECERGRRLPKQLVDAFIDAGFFRMLVPRALGGPEADPLTLSMVVEELSRADGSAGWCAMIGGTTTILVGQLDEQTAAEVFGDPRSIAGGALSPSGRAFAAEGGFRLSGRWPFGSGIEHSTWIGGGAIVFEGDRPRMREGGAPEWRLLLLPQERFEVIDTWDVSGLRGTGSHDFRIADAFVPDTHSVAIGGRATRPEPLYGFPLFGILSTGVASTALGIARAAVDEFLRLAREKTPTGARSKLADRELAQVAVTQAESALRSARAFLHDRLRDVWETVSSGGRATVEQRALLRMATTNATLSSAKAVDLVYTAGGGTSIYSHSPLQRCFRDVHAVTQHIVTAPPTQETVGRVLLGAETDTTTL